MGASCGLPLNRHVLSGALVLCSAVAGLWPAAHQQEVRWAWAPLPSLPTPYPHPAVQLREPEPAAEGAWVSPFLDLGGAGLVLGLEWPGAPAGIPYLRSAHRTRSFRIAEPRQWDAPTLSWSKWTGKYGSRRFLQLALAGGSPAEAPPPLRLRYSRRHVGVALSLLGLAVATLLWPRWRRHLPALDLQRGAALALALLVALHTARIASRSWVDPDEALLVDATRQVVKGDWTVHEYRYAAALAYLNAGVVTGLSLVRPLFGQVTHHDPATNQLFLDGTSLPKRLNFATDRKLFSPDTYPDLFFPESLGVVRKAYAFIGAALVLLVVLAGRAFGGPRAGLWAGLAIAVQPLLHTQAAHILPNVATALVGVAVVLFLRRPLDGWPRLLSAALLVGFASTFKYSPVLAIVFLPLVWFDRPTRSRPLSLAITAIGLPLGFLVGCPSALLHPREFVTYFAREAQIYAVVGQNWASADDPWPMIRHLLHLGRSDFGNLTIAAAFVVGAMAVLAGAFRGRIREAWLLLAPPVLALSFLSSFFIQYGRNYLAFLAFACVVAGVGAARLLDWIQRVWPARPHLSWAVGALWAATMLPVGRDCLLGTGQFGDPPNARVQAIRWVNDQAPLGSRVVIVEPDLGMLDGVTVDPRRFRVRRLPMGADLRGVPFDFAVRSGDEGLPDGADVKAFSGPGSSSLPTRYSVIHAAPAE